MTPEFIARHGHLLREDAWETCRILVDVDDINYVVCILEAHDNEFIVRTERRGEGWMRLWFARTSRPLLDAVLREMRTEIAIDAAEFLPGMAGIDEIFPDA